jgi:hypothetical protein
VENSTFIIPGMLGICAPRHSKTCAIVRRLLAVALQQKDIMRHRVGGTGTFPRALSGVGQDLLISSPITVRMYISWVYLANGASPVIS